MVKRGLEPLNEHRFYGGRIVMRGKRVRASLPVDDGLFGLLDENLLLNIFEKLQDSIDRQSWCLVCRRFLEVEARWKRSLKLLRVEVAEGVLRRYKDADELDLSFCLDVDDDLLLAVGRSAGYRLRSISLAKLTHFSDGGLVQLLRSCPSLRVLDLSHCSQIGDYGVSAVSQLTKLETLKMFNCRNVTDAGLGSIAAGCTALRHVSLRYCDGVTDAGISLLASYCKRLESLDLSYTEVTAKGLESLTTLQYLKELFVVGCNSVDDACLQCLTYCRSPLKVLDVAHCQNVSVQGIVALASGLVCLQQLTLPNCLPITDGLLASLEKWNCLQVIKLDGCEIRSPILLAFIGKGCKSLRKFCVSKCRGVTDEGIRALVEGCGDLDELDLTCCTELTDEAVTSIAKSCLKLQSLKMEACSQVTCRKLHLLGDGCTSLEEVDFTDCSIDDQGLKWLSRCSSLRSLKLGICLNITDVGIASIAASCWNLREIDLYRSLGIGDASVAAIAAGCPRLRVINLSYCERITDMALHSISQLRDLTQLAIRACPAVTSVGLSHIADGCKRLVDLDVKRCTAIDDEGLSSIVRGCQNLRQVNLSSCPITDIGLRAIGNLSCIQSLKLLHLDKMTACGIQSLLFTSSSLKKVKLLSHLRMLISPHVLQISEVRGCRFKWIGKHFP